MNRVESAIQTVYCIPGLGTSKTIFEFLPQSDQVNYVLLDQMLPIKGESFEHYIKRWADKIKSEQSIVIGVSFGGIIAQELISYKKVKKIILISSVKTPKAYPWFIKMFYFIPLHFVFLPLILSKLKRIKEKPKTNKEHKISQLLDRYMPYMDSHYIKWSVNKLIHWNPKHMEVPIVQIHGTKDEVFPYFKTKNAISIKDGTHAMLITKRKWFKKNLLNYLLD